MERNIGSSVYLTSSNSASVDNQESDSKIKIETFSANTAKKKMDIQMKLLVRILQYFGGYPIQVKIRVKKACKNKSDLNKTLNGQNNEIPENSYETTIFKWAEPGAWYAYFAFAFKTFCVLAYLGNIGWGLEYPVKLFSVGPGLKNNFWTKKEDSNYNGIVFAGNVILKILKSIFIFWNTPQFVCWLNNWSYFERDFENCFKTNVQLDIGRFSNRALFLYLALPTLMWTVSSIKWIPMYNYHLGIFSVVCMIVAIIATFVHPLMEDAKVLVMLKTQVMAFEQILVGIKECEKSRKLMIGADDVIGWQNLVKQARDQTALASECIKGQEIVSIAETILSCSAVASYVLKALTLTRYGHVLNSFVLSVLMNLYTCFLYLVRLYLKVLLAEKISATERLVADKILEIESKTGDADTKVELKFLYNHMVQNAVAVNFGNYFSLDKKLLLNVGAQVVTYLIVIMQFQSSK